MDPREHITPIIEPGDTVPIFLPPQETHEAYELAFPKEQRAWIRERDGGYSNMPLFDDRASFMGFDKTPLDYLEVHHITPQSWYRMHFGQRQAIKRMHNPLNGIALDKENHTFIHYAWKESYRIPFLNMPEGYTKTTTFDDYVKWQVEQGCPFWVNSYDGYFTATATIKTYEFMHATNTFPFPDEWVEVVEGEYAKLLAINPVLAKRIYTSL